MKRLTRAQAIKKHCFDCAGDHRAEVVGCEITDCPLWPYRLGSSPEAKSYQERLRNSGVFDNSKQ